MVIEGRRPPIPEPAQLPGGGEFEGLARYISLVQRCWEADPADRPTFAQVIPELK